MNLDLLENSIKYHGKELYSLIAKNDQANEAARPLLYTDEENRVVKLGDMANNEFQSEREERLHKRIVSLIGNKADSLFNKDMFKDYNNTSRNDDVICQSFDWEDEYMMDLPPLETFMDVSSKHRVEQLFKYLETGDEVIGCVDEVNDTGLVLNMVCFDDSKKRDLSGAKVKLFLSFNELVRSMSNSGQAPSVTIGSLRSTYFVKDLVLCTIIEVDKSTQSCLVAVSKSNGSQTGIIKPDEAPSYLKQIDDYNNEPVSFNRQIKKNYVFMNPACVDSLKKLLKIDQLPSGYSLMASLNSFKINKEDTAVELLKEQNRKLSLKFVQKGVHYLKEDSYYDALMCYKQALGYDESCVEAYVARGALYANKGEFDKAIVDLEKALQLDATHLNAKKYLIEVFLAYSVKFEKAESYDDTLVYLKKALDLEPDNKTIKQKYKDVETTKEELFSKSLYGPSFPSTDSKKKSKSRTTRSRSLSNSSSSSGSSVKVVKSSSSSKNKAKSTSSSHEKKRSSYSNSNSRHSLTVTRSEKERKRSADKDDEDLEDFYNQLKQKKAQGFKR